MKNILIVNDMQNDYIDGSLATAEAAAILPAVRAKIESYPSEHVYATLDTHGKNYPETNEGRHMPVLHCISGTEGWRIHPELADSLKKATFVIKSSFGSEKLVSIMKDLYAREPISIELIGVNTDLSVVSNALMLKAALPEIDITVDASCCAGSTKEKHAAALETMQSCQIGIVYGNTD